MTASPDYVERINRTIDHILGHLDEPLNLETLAMVACFSPFHFHRVFRLLQGETVAHFVKRVRLERALWMLTHQRPQSLTAIALECGFSSSSDFSRAFKQRYGVAPSRFDLDGFRASRRNDLNRLTFGKDGHRHVARLPACENRDGFEARVRSVPARCVAYVRVLNPFRAEAVPEAAKQMVAWAEARGLADGQWLGYMWDDPDLVALKDCRYDIGLEVPDVTPDGVIGRIDFPPMQLAEVRLQGTIDLEMRAIDWVLGTWLPGSGYVPGNHPFFEAWHGRPFEHGTDYFELSVQIPVQRA